MAPDAKTTEVDIIPPGMDHDSVYKRYKEQVPTNMDHTAPRRESLFSLPSSMKQAILPMLNDERDYIAAELLVNISVVLIPLTIAMYVYPMHSVMVAFLVGRLLVFGARFFLTLHVTSHRKLFKDGFWPLNSYLEVVISPLMGMPPGFYYIHHVMMHHVENNVFPYDVSSTMPHQRDSYLSLLHYISKYFTHAVLYLPYYALTKKRYKLFLYNMFFSFLYFGGGMKLYSMNPTFALWMVWIPFVVVGFVLMKGNFGQHLFVCPEDSFSNYRLAFNYINSPDNMITYNDGYHIIHHANSRLHWTEVPQYFEDNIEKFANNDAFIFHGIDNDIVFSCVFGKDYEKLYNHWLQLTPTKRTLEEFKELCKKRLQPIHKTKSS